MPDNTAKTGRPSLFTQAIADEICARLSKGEPLAVICRDDHMPAVQTVADWRKKSDALTVSIARAREDGFDALAAECLEIADDKSRDVKIVGQDGDEREVCDTEFVQRAKLRIETRLKLLAKWDPKRYGEKITQEITGEGGGPLITRIELVAPSLNDDS